jgi:hypothetical protein
VEIKNSFSQIKSDIPQETKRNYLSPSASRRGSGYGNDPGGNGGLSVFFQWLLANFRLDLNIELEMQNGTEL